MQTFLPYADFTLSAQSLDRQRLGKQRVETMQIMKALLNPDYGWQNHPAKKMWEGHEFLLLDYQVATVGEWERRGYKDTCLEKTMRLLEEAFPTEYESWLWGISYEDPSSLKVPWHEIPPEWLGNEEFHRSHQSNLIRKDPEHYAPQFPGVPDDLPYIWPSQEES